MVVFNNLPNAVNLPTTCYKICITVYIDHFRPLSTLMWSKNTFTKPWISLLSFLSTLYWDKTPWTGRSRLWTVVSCLVLCHGLWTRQTDDRKLIWGNLFIILYQIYPILWGHTLSENVEFAYSTCLLICMFFAIKNVEYQMSLPSDDERACMLYGSLAKEGHPMGKFFTGNLMSVWPNTIDVCIVSDLWNILNILSDAYGNL